jgi:hypothetical protein
MVLVCLQQVVKRVGWYLLCTALAATCNTLRRLKPNLNPLYRLAMRADWSTTPKSRPGGEGSAALIARMRTGLVRADPSLVTLILGPNGKPCGGEGLRLFVEAWVLTKS